MGRFDTKTFFELTGKGGGPVAALGTAFGMPSCLINLGTEALSILPTSILNSIRGSSANGANRADDVLKSAFAKLRFLDGHLEFDTEDGSIIFVSDSSKYGIDKNEGGALQALGDFVQALGAAAGFGGRLYNNYQTAQSRIDSIKDCIESYSTYLNYTGAASADKRKQLSEMDPQTYQDYISTQFGINRIELQEALQFKADALTLVDNIDSVIQQRINDPTLEPEFTGDYTELLTTGRFKVGQLPPEEIIQEVFRLNFGPPKSRQGKFILSVDGLYYDSQTSGIVPALLELENKRELLESNTVWKLEHDPNIGGKGKQLSLNDFKSYVNTILDHNIIDESNFMYDYYYQDVLLQDLIGQKNRRIFDVSAQINDLQNEGASQVLIANLRQVMLSETSHHLQKINKRKKQIELAVKMPSIYGKGSLYAPGEIPINDFSYLEGINFGLDIENQKRLVLDQADVSSVVLPLQVKYIKQIDSQQAVVLDHLLISNIGLGNIVSDGSSVDAPTLGVTSRISSEGLVAFYNYLTAGVETTSSLNYSLFNSAKTGIAANAQLVGSAPSSIFSRGVGIVYLDGITKNSTTTTTLPSSLGSYIKLPDTKHLQDLLHNPNGATFDTWVHVPNLENLDYGFNSGSSVQGLYRLILANENTGVHTGYAPNFSIDRIPRDDGTNTVNGLILGFTRDRRITLGASASNDDSLNPVSSAAFFLAPTQSYSASSVGFISIGEDRCSDSDTWYNMKVPLASYVSGESFSACGNEFCHVVVTFNPKDKEVSIYLDSQLMAVSSYYDVFGNTKPPVIPSLIKNNSFEYNSSSMSAVPVQALNSGPKLDKYFTPWILGGGYTDGLQNGNFMGGTYGGKISGLRGYLGSTKFYNRCLSNSEVRDNYLTHNNFFKNIIFDFFGFTVIGSDDVTTGAAERFVSVVSDGDNLYIGSEDPTSSGSLWKYNEDDGWAKINLPSSLETARAVKSLEYASGTLYLGTGGSATELYAGKVFSNSGSGWSDLGLSSAVLPGYHSEVRALLIKDANLYAGGSYSLIFKKPLSGVWVDDYIDAQQFHWMDFKTDGTNIYAAANAAQASGNVFKYDGASWTQISTNGFGSIFNYCVPKICLHNDNLYAATTNIVSGTQIWKYSGAGTAWTKINKDGFGSRNNFNVVDMKSVRSKLVVSTENTNGGQIWYYDELDGWNRQETLSYVTYESYLISEANGQNYLIGRSPKRFIPSTENPVVYHTAQERRDNLLTYWPDGLIGGISLGNDLYRFITANAYFTVVTEGSLSSIASSIISPSSYSVILSAIDLSSPMVGYSDAGVVRGDVVRSVKTEASSYSPSSTAYNIVGSSLQIVQPYDGMKYYSVNTIYKIPSTSTVLGFCHTESGYWDPSGAEENGWRGSIRLAISQDNGLTFSDVGNILTSPAYEETIFSGTSGEQATDRMGYACPIVEDDGYLYLYFSNNENPDGASIVRQTLAVARAPLSSVVASAQIFEPASFSKYYNGSYSQPGLGGSATELMSFPPGADSGGSFYVFYSTTLEKYVAFYTSQIIVLDSNLYFDKSLFVDTNTKTQDIYACYSDDGIKWSFPELIGIGDHLAFYSNIIHANMETNRCGRDFRFLHLRGYVRTADVEGYDISTQEIRNISRSYPAEDFV